VLRLRFFRVLLPLLLLFMGILVWRSWKAPPDAHSAPNRGPENGAPVVQGLSIKEFGEGSTSTFDGQAEVAEPHDDGSLHLEGIRDLELQREDRGPLLVSAARADRTGQQGQWHWSFEEQVVFREPDKGLEVTLASLQIDDAIGEARSSGSIRFEAPNLKGRAESLVYGLHGQTGEMRNPEFEDLQGGRLTARRAVLLDGVRDVELVDEVRVDHAEGQLSSDALRLIRGPEDRLRQALATGDVAGFRPGREVEPEASFRAEKLDLRWDEVGEVDFLSLSGEAWLARGDPRDDEAARAWKIDARDHVLVQGRFGEGPGLLRAERVLATLDAEFTLRQAEALGGVTYDGQETRAEAERGTFHATEEDHGQIELFGDDLRKARLATGRTRIAARTIRTDARGSELIADGLVEATILPQRDGAVAATAGRRLFVAEKAIHFVSNRLVGLDTGKRLSFEGAVRGWQGERNLAAQRVVVSESEQTVQAIDSVSTRFPREPEKGAAAEADFVQISSRQLDYSDATGLAVYTGEVRVRLVEGWLDAERVEVELARETRQVREIRAEGSVRIEFHRTSDGELDHPISGTSDGLLYTPSDATVMLYGEESPAAVRHIGAGGGTTTGRVLRYRVDTGTLDVESGDEGPGRIRS
jgi:lipopolysaccharide transport protein LptA